MRQFQMPNFKCHISNKSTIFLEIGNWQLEIPAKQEGQTLIEVLAALTAAVVIVGALVSASLNALKSTEFTRDQNISSQYTQAGMEIMRDMRNNDIGSFTSSNLPDGTYCLAKSCTQLISTNASCWKMLTTCPQNVDKYVREVAVSHNASDCNASPTPNGQTGVLSSNVKITVTTSWYDTQCTSQANQFCHSTTTSSCFSDFVAQPTP